LRRQCRCAEYREHKQRTRTKPLLMAELADVLVLCCGNAKVLPTETSIGKKVDVC
jgi:hypothetical protein